VHTHNGLRATRSIPLAQRAEAATFEAVFFADGPAPAENIQFALRFRLEPITLLAGIAAATPRIGLIVAASTTHHELYNLERLFASVDHLSPGRVGWNIVTTSTAAAAQISASKSIRRMPRATNGPRSSSM
jgi:alkanesulfonate monooxygenase SsuD/methylene tetrahydromethanopterin reductase-like flavin-dependent oxidoreductase (luciferase family)